LVSERAQKHPNQSKNDVFLRVIFMEEPVRHMMLLVYL
jgi:hypothetical protein